MPDRSGKKAQICPESILGLIERFNLHAETYRRDTYNETQLRREFIDPFFKSLGWDIDNEQGHAVAYKEVIHEDAIKVGGSTKAPDYCFRIGGVSKFFVEPKKPSDQSITTYELQDQHRPLCFTATVRRSEDFESHPNHC